MLALKPDNSDNQIHHPILIYFLRAIIKAISEPSDPLLDKRQGCDPSLTD